MFLAELGAKLKLAENERVEFSNKLGTDRTLSALRFLKLSIRPSVYLVTRHAAARGVNGGAACRAEMVTLLITSFVILGFLVLAIYLLQKPNAPPEDRLLTPPEHRSLFSDQVQSVQSEDGKESSSVQRAEIIARARVGAHTLLPEAKALGDAHFYEEVLNLLTAGATRPQLLSLVSYIVRHDLPVNKTLAEKFIELWRETPDRESTAKMLHLAALSDNAETYRSAVTYALDYHRNGKLSTVTKEELKAVIEGEYWLLSANTRSSGAGFVLKQALTNARHELEAAHER
jgi:hypothetical protein